ncbi:MAG: EAL domain-containing protein [Coprobacillus sp.]
MLDDYLVDAHFIFESLSNNTNDYIYAWDFHNGSYITSENLAEDFSIEKEGKDFVDVWYSFVHPRDIKRVIQAIHESICEKKKIIRIEYQVTSSNGHCTWLSDKSTVRYNSQTGDPEVVIGIMHNLSLDGEVDAITGLLMHNKCKEMFDLLRNHKIDNYGSLMLLGIDDFASINTLNSHSFGDEVLRTTVQDLLMLFPENIEMYRYDGDQFLIVAEKMTKNELLNIYGQIKEYTSTSHVIQDKSYRFTISAGVACYPQDSIIWTELEKAVSIAMKKAKDTGKNQCVEFTSEMLEEKINEKSLGRYLADSIEHDFKGFKVVYQPVCYTQDLKVKGAEILLRFVTPNDELVSPDRFIPLLEQSQLIIPVGLWVLEKAIQTCKKWINYIDDFVMNVNVSYIQLRDSSFCDNVEKLLKKYDLDTRHIIIELTESYFIIDAPNIKASMKRLNELNLRVAMDDFGTGYSSLARLSQFNVDVVKIDKSFVQSLHKSKYNYDFIESVVRLCHNVGMKVCVEGVETREEQESICVLNADFMQGFYVSKPIDFDQFFSSFITNPDINNQLVVVPNMQLRHKQLVGDRDVLMAMMNATPLALNFWNRDIEIIACNTEVLNLFEAKNLEDFKRRFIEYSPERQPNGVLSSEYLIDVIQRAFNGEKVRIFWEHCNLNKEVIPTEVTIVRIPYMDDYVVASYTRDMREQQRMEAEIEKFNIRLRAILDAIPLCLNLWDRNHNNIMCNKVAVDMYGLSSEEEYMKHFFELSPKFQPNGDSSPKKANEYIEEAFEVGRKHFEWMHCLPNGTEFPAEITLVKIDGLGENGSDLLAGYTRDMRQQRMMEEKIEKFNIRLRAILDASPLCLNLWNEKFENIMCNTAAVKLFELHNQEEYMEKFFELSPQYQPDGSLSSEKAIEYIKEAYAVGTKQFEWAHCKLNGEIIPTEITLVKIEGLDEDGGDLVAGYTRDMRNQIESEKIQQSINARTRAVIDSSPLACILWSDDLEIIDCNQVAVNMFQANDKQEIINDFDSFMPLTQPDGENSMDKKDRIFQELFIKNNDTFEWVYLNKNKEEVPCEVSVVRIPLEKENIIVAHSRDLRELHHTLELNDRLSKMAYYDLLTGVTSRARFVEKLNNDFKATLPNDGFALVIFDIDFFKSVNDSHGHPAGDMVLKRVARSVEKTIPQRATLGRLGGDEFIIEIPNIKKDKLKVLLNEIIDNIANMKFHYNGVDFHSSISMGASFKIVTDESYHHLLNRADKALYIAKEKGRNRGEII